MTRYSVGLAILVLLGCSTSRPGSGPYAPQREFARDPLEARRLTDRALDVIATDPDRAEQLLREALAADLYDGRAHNNLGVLYLNRGMLYEASGEFEWARKLMPGHPDPRLNLGLALERAGRHDEALASYGAALEVYANHLPSLRALASLQLRTGRSDDRTMAALREIALRGDAIWRAWARVEMASLRDQSPAS